MLFSASGNSNRNNDLHCPLQRSCFSDKDWSLADKRLVLIGLYMLLTFFPFLWSFHQKPLGQITLWTDMHSTRTKRNKTNSSWAVPNSWCRIGRIQELMPPDWLRHVTHLLNEHVATNHAGRHVSVLLEELRDPITNHRKQRHQVLDDLQTKDAIFTEFLIGKYGFTPNSGAELSQKNQQRFSGILNVSHWKPQWWLWACVLRFLCWMTDTE